MRFFKSFIFFIFLVNIIFSQEWASLSGSFLRMGITARSIAMGGGFTAEKDHGFSSFYNPAFASFLLRKQLGFSFSNLTLDRRLASTSFAAPLPPTAGIGVAWVNAGVTNIQGRNSTGEKTVEMQTGENAFMFTFAQRIKPWFSVGVNIKILQHQLPINEELKGSGIGFDIGFLIKSGRTTTFGVMIQDLSSNYQWNTSDYYAQGRQYKDAFPTTYRAGARFLYKDLILATDLGLITDHKTFSGLLPRIGIEYAHGERYFFRGGYGNGRVAFGWGLDYSLLKDHDSKIDYSFSMDWASQTAHTLSYAFNF